jgi:hypothetical protein
MNPPHHAAIFCEDEKTAIQVLDRLDPVLPPSPGRAERHRFEYSARFVVHRSLPAQTDSVPGLSDGSESITL